MQEDPTNPYEIGKNPEPIEDDRMSEGYEPTEVPEGYRAPESPGERPMEIDLFQKIPRRGKNRNHDHWEVDLDKLVLRRVHSYHGRRLHSNLTSWWYMKTFLRTFALCFKQP